MLGRKTICTPDIIKDIANYIKLGNSNVDAATNVGIASPTFYNWLKRGENELVRVAQNPRNKIRQREQPFVDFLEAVKKAIPQRKANLLARIQKASTGGEEILETREKYEDGQLVERVIVTKHRAAEWQASAWLLERLHYDEFGRRSRVDIFDWRQELKVLWETGKITREEIVNELGSELASEFFITEGVITIGPGEAQAENGNEQPE